ncbi:MAG: SRPBCC domain-containing protein [Lewinellaceae bacterium]|nr:SRPBCC domain-containing protein [Lewinellaceae bacterium]
MNSTDKVFITVGAIVNAPVEKVWAIWTSPEHIMQWNAASDDWHTTAATNDLTVGGKFSSYMAAKDGSMGFDFWGVYDEVKPNEKIAYTMGDGRTAEIHFPAMEPEQKWWKPLKLKPKNSIELQQGGWQAIMNNFKAHVESLQG